MINASPEVDDYIACAGEFARPILSRIRELFHQACPEIREELKWSFPHFTHQGIVGSMAAFKKHVSFGFWKASLMRDPMGYLKAVGETSMGGARITTMTELPPEDVMIEYIQEAVRLNVDGVKVVKPKPKKKPKLAVPEDLQAAFKKNKKAQKTFDGFSPSQKNDYVEWITEAKQPATRKKRLTTAIEWMSGGKPRNWKYMKRK